MSRVGTTVVLAALLVLARPAGAQEAELMKVRISAASPGDGANARAAAVQQAERDIIRQTLEAALALEDLTPLDPLIKQPAPFIRSTQLVRFETVDDTTRVEVECYVKRKDLLERAALVLLPRMVRPPVVLVLMAEQLGSAGALDASRTGAAETALSAELRQAGLDVADPVAARAGFDGAGLLAKISGAGGSAAELAARAGAQAVILGEAVVSEGEMAAAGNVHTLSAGVTVRVYRGSDGRQVDSVFQEAVVQSLNPVEGAVGAIGDACAKLAKEAALYAVLAAVAPARQDELIVTVEGPGPRERFDQLLLTAESTGGAGSVQEIFFTGEMARFRVKYAGRVSDFVDTILGQKYEGFALEPRHVVQRDVLLLVTGVG